MNSLTPVFSVLCKWVLFIDGVICRVVTVEGADTAVRAFAADGSLGASVRFCYTHSPAHATLQQRCNVHVRTAGTLILLNGWPRTVELRIIG